MLRNELIIEQIAFHCVTADKEDKGIKVDLSSLPRRIDEFNQAGILLGSKVDGRFKIEEILYYSPNTIVYQAWDEERDAPAAVKVFRNELEEGSRALNIFEIEQKIMAHHSGQPGFLAYFAHGKDASSNLCYIAMELISGKSVYEIMMDSEWKIPLNRAVDLLLSLCRPLSALHRSAALLNRYPQADGIAHRDLKIENIIVRSTDGSVCLIDFGAARPLLRKKLPWLWPLRTGETIRVEFVCR